MTLSQIIKNKTVAAKTNLQLSAFKFDFAKEKFSEKETKKIAELIPVYGDHAEICRSNMYLNEFKNWCKVYAINFQKNW